MTPDQIADCRGDLLEYSKTMFRARKGVDMLHSPHLPLIADHLERVVLGDITRLIINMPPRSGKTELAVISFISWCMGNFPDSEFIHASYSKRLAAANTYSIRAVMQNETYQSIFDHTSMSDDSKARDEFRTSQGGIVYATGAEGTITGYGAGGMTDRFKGAILIDDPHKAGEAASVTMRKNVIDWFGTTIESRKNSPETPIIIVMQRLHEEDLSGWLLGGGNGEEWDHLVIPAIQEDGGSFWPRQFPLDMLNRIRDTNSYVFSGQYMQRPAPAGGGIFKSEWVRHWKVLPPLEYRMIYADTAQKTGEENDFSVLEHWGKGRDGNIYLIDMIRGRYEAPQLLSSAIAFWDKCKSADSSVLRKMKVEDKSSGTGLIQQLKQAGIPVEGIPRSRDKVSRAHDTAPMMEAGRVYLPERSDHLSDLLSELALFPVAKNDDTIDPLMDAIMDMLIGTGSYPAPLDWI